VDPQMPVQGVAGRQEIDKTNNFGQVYRRYSKEEQDALVKNITADISSVAEQTKLLAICNFYRAEKHLGKRLAKNLGIDLTPYLQHLNN
jgi:catalase